MSGKELTLKNLTADTAFPEILEWIEPHLLKGGPTPEDWLAQPARYLWALGKGYDVPLEILERCARESPWAALAYAVHLLTPELLKWCARQDPWSALLYAAAYLTPELLKWCARREPRAALAYAPHLLTPELLKWCKDNS